MAVPEMTRLVVAYDAELPGECLAAARGLVALHERLGIPATWFVVGRLLEDEPDWRPLLDSPLFEVASHTYSHALLRPCRSGDPAIPDAERAKELLRGRLVLEDALGRPCLGVRPANGYPTPLDGDQGLIAQVIAAGFQYTSSQLWAPGYRLPAPLRVPRRYSGLPLVELPGHGWHENVWKARRRGTPEGEAAMYVRFVERASQQGRPYVSPVWHPWSLGRADPTLRMPAQFLEQVRGGGAPFSTFAGEHQRVAPIAAGSSSASTWKPSRTPVST